MDRISLLSDDLVVMDRISLLSDDLIVRILSFVPTKDAVTTSLLSKRWTSLWKLVTMLEYTDPYSDTEYLKASRFIDKFLLLHKGRVLDTLSLSLGRNCPPTDIETWIRIAVSRGLRTLVVMKATLGSGPCSGRIRLPRSIYSCETLEVLLVHPVLIVDIPLTICFRSLRKLYLDCVEFSSDEVILRLLSGCPVLVELYVVLSMLANVKTFNITVPSLRVLTLIFNGIGVEFVINTPSLRSFTIASQVNGCSSSVNMPHILNADIKLHQGDLNKFLGCLTSSTHLTLCLKSPMELYSGNVFSCLVSLNICTCSFEWCRLLLRYAPKLRVLRFVLHQVRVFPSSQVVRCCSSCNGNANWEEQPGSVPQCLISSLKTIEWIDYKGTEAEKKLVMYLLENTRELETVAIRTLPSTDLAEKYMMLQELASTQRSSSQCRLSFI